MKKLILLLDKSGSMSGPKWISAVNGVKEIWKADFDEKTLITFNDWQSEEFSKSDISSFDFGNPNNGTPLWRNLVKVIEICREVKRTTHVVVNIFTDGKDTEGWPRDWDRSKAHAAIKELSDSGVAFTFLGTEEDVKSIQDTLGLSSDNVLAHDNTGESVEMVYRGFKETLDIYSKDIDAGVANTRKFFKNKK